MPNAYFDCLTMITRSRRETVRFLHAANVAGLDRALDPGAYEVVIEEDLIEGLSFASYRRVATLITIPSASRRAVEMVAVDPTALADALARDVATAQGAVSAGPHDR